jgi:hypothetical protein
MNLSPTAPSFLPRPTQPQPGFFWADNEIISVFGPRLGAHGIAVYMQLCWEPPLCQSSMRQIGERVGMSKGGVFNALGLIVSLGLARKVGSGYELADVKALARSSGERWSDRSSGERDRSSGERAIRNTKLQNLKNSEGERVDTTARAREVPKKPPLSLVGEHEGEIDETDEQWAQRRGYHGRR